MRSWKPDPLRSREKPYPALKSVRYQPLTRFSPAHRLTGLHAFACPLSPHSRQRSFNRQSTAFVMRGLWVRLPPLALRGEGTGNSADADTRG